ncbi:MAG: NAD(P)H-binding protein [Alphaproteobacteria bacterium]|nr:NAD(P)H-binding protein [Alphaproteobacteria bacterium]
MQVTVLGITGAVGAAVAEACLARGIPVRALVRDPKKVQPREGLVRVTGDVRDPAALASALEGSEVVLHGVNLPYPDWDPGMLDLTRDILAAVEKTGATLLFPGNVYGLGPDYEAPLAEGCRHEPITRKGALRNRLEAMLAASSARTVILRAGDFYGGGEAWMWHLTHRAVDGGAIQYGGDLGILHGWAYLPDLAETFVRLALRRAELGAHEVFHFEGHVVDGHTWVAAVRDALGAPDRRVTGFPWFWLNFVRPFVPMVRELFEMRYLWDQPVRLDGSRLRAFLGDVPHTPFAEAVARALAPGGA